MHIGMIGLGRMGAGLVQRLTNDGHHCVVYDVDPSAVKRISNQKIQGAISLKNLAEQLPKPHVVWIMVPAAVTDGAIEDLVPHLESGDIIIDGGNSFYRDDILRAQLLKKKEIHYVDCGTSGGVFGLERGYCLMIGGEKKIVQYLDPVFKSIAPGIDVAERTNGRTDKPSSAEYGYLHCGPAGAGHFVKMVHNGIEYGLMAAYAEGLNILRNANVGKRPRAKDAETAPIKEAEFYQYDFDLADITEVWRRGSVIGSWLLDLTAASLSEDSDLDNYIGNVPDSGEGRWTITTAIDESVPTPVLSAALYQRFSSRGEDDFANKVLSAMRKQFGGHEEKKD